VTNTTVRGGVKSDHAVQFFDTDESRAQSVAAFLAEGYAAGESLVVVARPVNWAAMIEPLERLGVPVRAAVSSGRLVVKDAEDTLRRLSRNGMPDKTLFKDVVAHQIASLALTSGHRVRAYGEMVDLLAQRGEFSEAIALEFLWNSLSERVPIFLLCGYSSAHFVSASTHRALRDICRCHTGVHRDAEDPLGAWVLTAAHNGPSGGDSLRH
jgi:MEDS: MEthanogen/methylotroph, DcmR Sensory domain